MVSFGYVEFTLKPGWIARIDVSQSRAGLVSLRGAAWLDLSFVSAGDVNQESNLNLLYDSLEKKYRLEGFHFNDLAEDFDYEMITELPSDDKKFAVIHIFLRLCEDIIVAAALRDFDTQEEDDVRTMLGTLTRGPASASREPLARLEMVRELVGWDWMGDVATSADDDQ